MKKTFLALVLAVVMALSVVGGAFAEEGAAIKIGLIGPMTGENASYGRLPLKKSTRWAAFRLSSTCRMIRAMPKPASTPTTPCGIGARR